MTRVWNARRAIEWLSLGCALLLTGSLTPRPLAPGCPVVQKQRVFVGFSGDFGLPRYEEAAVEAKSILRAVHDDLCDAQSRAQHQHLSRSLRAALAGARPVVLDEVHFSAPALDRADVLLTAAAHRWRATLQADDAGWQLESVRDEARVASARK